MRAALFKAPHSIEVGDRPDASISEPTDAVVRVTLACVCGSDLWYYRGDSPFEPGPDRARVHGRRRGCRVRRPEHREGRLRDRAVRLQRRHLPALPPRGHVGLRRGRLLSDERRWRPGRGRARAARGRDARARAGVRRLRRDDAFAAHAHGCDGDRSPRGRLRRRQGGRHGGGRRRRRGRPLRRPRGTAPGRGPGHRAQPPRRSSGARTGVRRDRHRRAARRGGCRDGPWDDRWRRGRWRAGVRRHGSGDGDCARGREAWLDGRLRGRPAWCRAADRGDVLPQQGRARRVCPGTRLHPGAASGRAGRTIDPGLVLDFETDLDGVAEAYAAMDERRAIKSLVRVGAA